MSRNYVICTTQRSGKSWLCDVLGNLGGFGEPEETVLKAIRDKGRFGSVEALAGWLERTSKERPVATVLQWDALVVLGKMMGKDKGLVLAEMAKKHGFAVVFLERRDRVQQAISKYLLVQSGYGHSRQAGQAELVVKRGAVPFDAEGILRMHKKVVGAYSAWERLFVVAGVEPVRLSYEEMCGDLRAAVAVLAKVIGRDASDLTAERVSRASGYRKVGDAKDVEFRKTLEPFLRSRKQI